MARPKEEHPTSAELEVLKVLWQRGPSTVRDVLEVLNESRPRAYTSVMSLMNVMTEKGQLARREHGRAFLYEPACERDATLGNMVADLLGRAFEGSASQLVAHLLDQSRPDSSELDEIRKAIQQYKQQGTSGNDPGRAES
jgi:BlaI family transcriptional regulator, penicillinase repressor